MAPERPVIAISIAKWILERKWRVYYLLPPDPFNKLGDILTTPVDDRFTEVVTKYANGFLHKGEMPPADIAPAIFNALDDYAAGRDVVLRTGDYIAIRSHLRQSK